MKEIQGGVCAAKGFRAAGIHCGIRKNREKADLALIVSDRDCSAAACYTRNRVKAAPVYVSREHLKDGRARAIICNSGNANACAPNGKENAIRMCKATASALKIDPMDVVCTSTGVIGEELPVHVIETAMPALVGDLSYDGGDRAANAILTTDTVKKECSFSATIGGKEVKIGGIAKGSGMIHPNMGTMLAFITTDANITAAALQAALSSAVTKSFNRVSVDGDTSTNDMAVVLANGMAENPEIVFGGEGYEVFAEMLFAVCCFLARSIARDGEGATRMVTCRVSGAKNEEDAVVLAKSVICSSLVKAAMFGADANWGRVLCAMGYSGVEFDPEEVTVSFVSKAGKITVCENGAGLVFDEDLAKKILSEDEVEIRAYLRAGDGEATAWGCDLTYDYVKINGDYRT
ncbi:MAG: bifunctional glutamate N-acetyltransferase/amino-acid acetyltransferase ArgJ [Oscillospiraceae bacterium]|nr:bifunctional glutamate N-acetyltransferase/amino-acid acetyltransferase ArgJ [Oscillospiraceae bacterium]